MPPAGSAGPTTVSLPTIGERQALLQAAVDVLGSDNCDEIALRVALVVIAGEMLLAFLKKHRRKEKDGIPYTHPAHLSSNGTAPVRMRRSRKTTAL